jgi:hypothetical protein
VAPSAAVPVSVVPSAVSGVVQPAVPSDNLIDPAQAVNTRVLVAVYDPLVDATTGTHLCEYMHWNRAEDIVHGFMQDITTASAGLAAFTVVQQVDLDEFPVLTDGYSYDAKTYLDLENNVQPAHQPQMADYSAIMNGLNIVSRVDSQDIDEVWLFGFPYAGFYESCMGGAGAFWCNGPVIPGTASCSRRFVVMGLSYERGVGEMLHSFGHRCESILTQTYSKTAGDANLYARFSRYDKTSPGKAELGTVHYPPNALQDYDYDNSTLVPSNCYDWYNFPNFKDDVRQVNASEWGNGDMESLHSWWLKHMPKVAGQTNGIANNWWQYIMNPNLVPD